MKEKMLLASWVAVNKNAPFEEIAFAIEDGRRVFNSWLHARPDYLGASWTLTNCVLKITHPTEPALSYTFNVRIENKQLILKQKDESGVAYKRLN